ncbi:MAG: hypothetical protein GX964_02360 [Syntrophomonadaceae bacterium]|jgi:stage III sporulation protein AB|nr:hypothetical protein [Syntrophomonadaceae bacterium]
MLVKLTGAAFIIGACGVYGLSQARTIENRVRHLRSLRFGAAILAREITYIQNPLPRALEKAVTLASFPAQELFKVVMDHLCQGAGYTAAEAWSRGAERLRDVSDLKAEDISLIDSFGAQLGMSDVEAQKKAFRLLEEELKLQEQRAAEAVAAEKKLWSYGGFLLGCLIVLLMI